jgi:NAD(P)-dependent dehydrogenase (short-subunit alcohol dehydrogenase family)
MARVGVLRQMNGNPSASSSPAIVITGASTGIGWACALELDRRGFRVFAGVRTAAAAERLRAEASSRLTPLTIDVTEADTIAAAAKTVAEGVGDTGLAGLVNNAGIVVPGPLELIPIDAFRRQLEVNVTGQLAVTQAFLPLLRKARGRIVNMSSISGGLSTPYLGPYAASKFAIEAISDALRLELRNFGIRVSAIEPGAITTPIWDKSTAAGEQLAAGADPARRAPYEPDLEVIRKAVEYSVRTASPVERVVKAVLHALTASRPKAHYYLGWSVRVCFKAMKMLPDRLRDPLVRKLIGLR